jgi:hypothetical protein
MTTQKFLKKDQILETRVNDELILFDASLGNYHSLSTSGQAIWDLLTEPRSIDQIRDVLATRFAVPLERCETETHSFVEQLLERQLISRVSDGNLRDGP